MPRLPRILYAVPQLPHVHLEIAKAIQTLGSEGALEKSQHPDEAYTPSDTPELVAEIVREFLRELRKAGFRPDQPRWSKGSGDISGRWSAVPAQDRRRLLNRPRPSCRSTIGA
jgi:hypothetical protein